MQDGMLVGTLAMSASVCVVTLDSAHSHWLFDGRQIESPSQLTRLRRITTVLGGWMLLTA